jgi:hypothetical protein
MAFAEVVGADHYTNLAGIWQWKEGIPVFCLLMVANVLYRTAVLRLVANGYPPIVKRLIMIVWGAAFLLTSVFSEFLNPGLYQAANVWPMLLIASLEFLGISGSCLIAAWLLPPRRGKSVGGPRPRRHSYRRWIPVAIVCGLLEAVLQLNDGGSVMPWVAAVGYVAMAFMLAILERNYRNQEDATNSLSLPGAVLLLRTFTRDLFAQEEARLAKEVRRQLGDFIALGNPREVLPPGGARRVYLADGAWRAHLTELASRSRVILMWPDATPAVLWELAMIRDGGLQQKLFVIVPPRRPRRTWLDIPPELLRFLSGLSVSNWSDFAWALEENGFRSPEHAPGPGSVLTFEPDGQCVVLARGLLSTRELVARIAERLVGLAEPAQPSNPDRARQPYPGSQMPSPARADGPHSTRLSPVTADDIRIRPIA